MQLNSLFERERPYAIYHHEPKRIVFILLQDNDVRSFLVIASPRALLDLPALGLVHRVLRLHTTEPLSRIIRPHRR